MHFRIQVVIVAEDGAEHFQEIADLLRSEPTMETLGLTLEEGKQILHSLQETLVAHQVTTYLAQQRPCPHCGKARSLKESDTAPFRTLFGTIQVPNPRWHHCDCQAQEQHTFRPLSPLLPERASPELLYLETKWAALASYGVTTDLLKDALPVDAKLNPETIRNHMHRVAEKMEKELGEEKVFFAEGCAAERDRLPIPDGPLTVGLDGGIVRGRRDPSDEKAPRHFEVIAGKSILSFRRDDPEDTPPSSKCFALVQGYDKKPRRRLYELLTAQGMQANQQITFFSDGGDTVRKIPEYLHPDSEHVLDWFHITMRITVLQQCARGLSPAKAPAGDTASEEEGEASLERRLESIKHYLWHGNARKALDRISELEDDLEGWDYDENGEKTSRPDSDAAARMHRYLREFRVYIENNSGYLVNYGERHRNGERISTGFVESTVNQVVSKRMVKKQQMQWTPRGAHLLLQVRTQVLNGDWEGQFRQWYPSFRPVAETPSTLLAAA